MNIPKTGTRLHVDFAWVLSGNVIYSACQWAIVIVLAKLGNPQQVGEYALGMAVSAPIVLFANLQLRALLATELKDRFSFAQYLAFRLVSLGAALIVVAGVAAFTQSSARLAAIVILVGFAQILDFLSETYYGLMQKQERLDRISRSLMMKGPLSVFAVAVAMYLGHSAVWAVIALGAARLLIVLSWDVRLGFVTPGPVNAGQKTPSNRLQWDSREMLTLLRMALPLGVISMLVSLNVSIPRYFLEAQVGSSELGLFSAIASLLTAGTLVVSAFGQSIFLPVARAYADGDRTKIRTYLLLASGLGCGLGVAGILSSVLFGREILARTFRPEYGNHAAVFVQLTAAGTFMFIASGMGYVITAARQLVPQIPILVASLIAVFVASAWSIPRSGMSGAAAALFAGACVQVLGTGLVFWKMDRGLIKPGNRTEQSPIRTMRSWLPNFEGAWRQTHIAARVAPDPREGGEVDAL
jgi:O-antigen/teichoic acid export membrane protein